MTVMTAAVGGGCTPPAPQLGEAPIKEVVSAMTLEEKVDLLVGTGMEGVEDDGAVVGSTDKIVPGAAGTTCAIPRLGIPAIVLADGPAGLRIDPTREGDDSTYYCTHFPMATMLASTWNTELVERVGKAIGEEAHEYGADILLAPALNIQRNPLCGRNFEYYSEDPLVSGRMAAAYVRGVQSNGVGATIKHFAVNNQETNRTFNDARLSRRALREIYLKGFEIAVREGRPYAVMSSYNAVNGVCASENRELVNTLLRGEWGFDGLVMTDWVAGNDAVAMMKAGNEMLQPGLEKQKKAIREGVESGQLDESVLDTNVTRVLELIARTPRFHGYKYSNRPDLKAHAAITRQSATEGMVLLKNEGSALPLSGKIRNIALFGSVSYDFMTGGSGSGSVNHAYTVSLLDGLLNAGYSVHKELRTRYERHVERERQRIAALNLDTFTQGVPPPEEMEVSPELMRQQAGETDAAVITFGRRAGEFSDRKLADFYLKPEERALLEAVCKTFHASGKRVIVVLNIAGSIETASWKELPDAILCAWQGGQESGNSVADILCGRVSPSGKLTMTFPLKYEDMPSSPNFPIDKTVSETLSDKEKEEISKVKDVGYTVYEEGIYVGYRYFDSFGRPVSYPFGYGLSYTEFAYSNPKIRVENGVCKVSVHVKNTGRYAGKEVVQLYVSAPEAAKRDKPEKELKAFAKTRELKPGEESTVTMEVNAADLASFDERLSAWVTEEGTYKFMLASSSRDIRASVTAEIPSVVREVRDLLKPRQEIKELAR